MDPYALSLLFIPARLLALNTRTLKYYRFG